MHICRLRLRNCAGSFWQKEVREFTVEDEAGAPGMSTLLKLLFANGASTVYAVRVGAGGGLEAYQAAFAALANCDVQVVVCDSSELTIQKALKTAVETASAARGERRRRSW